MLLIQTFHAFLQDDQLPTSMQPQPLGIKTMRKAISTGFLVTDQQALMQAQQCHWVDGAVCVAVWIVQDTIFVANVGLMSQLSPQLPAIDAASAA